MKLTIEDLIKALDEEEREKQKRLTHGTKEEKIADSVAERLFVELRASLEEGVDAPKRR